MIYMLFTGINYNKLIVEKNRDSIFTTDYEHIGNLALELSMSEIE